MGHRNVHWTGTFTDDPKRDDIYLKRKVISAQGIDDSIQWLH
jgi:hypothetical protein